MSDDALLVPARQPAPPASAVIPDDLQHRTPIVDQFFAEGHLFQIRSTVAAHASQASSDPNRIGIAVLLTSELVINAIRHGGGYGWLRLWLLGTGLYIQVADQGSGMDDPTAGTIRPTPGQVHHRGLWIIRELADTVKIETGPTGTTVTLHLA